MTTWFRHSRRIEPITRSTYAFCHGERGAVTTSVIPLAATRLLKTEPYAVSRSRSRKLGAVSQGKASTILLRKPGCRGMLRNIESHNPSATVSQDDHNVDQSKRGRHGNEHVDCGDAECFVAQEATPGRRRRPSSSHHVLRDCGLADLNAEPQQLAVDARRTPQRVGAVHLSDQITNVATY